MRISGFKRTFRNGCCFTPAACGSGTRKGIGSEPLLYYFGSRTFQISAYHKNIYSHLQEEDGRRDRGLLYAPFSKSSLDSASQNQGAVGIVPAFADYQIPESRIPIMEYGMFAGDAPSVTPDNYRAGFDAGRMYVSAGAIFSSLYLISPERIGSASRNFCLHIGETWMGVRDALSGSAVPYPEEISWNVKQQHVGQMRELLQKIRTRKNRKPVLFLVATHNMAEEIAFFQPPFGLSIPKDICIILFIKRFQDFHRIRLDNFAFNHSDMARIILDELDAIRSGHPVASRIQHPMKFCPEGSCIPAFYRKNGISRDWLQKKKHR